MSKKKKSSARAALASAIVRGNDVKLVPQSTAHTIRRVLEVPPAHLAKMKECLAQGMPMKIALDVTSKLYAVPNGESRRALDGGLDDEEIIIDEQPIEPPDDGGEIPEEEEEEAPELAFARSGPEIKSISIEIYAVAVFRPKYTNTV